VKPYHNSIDTLIDYLIFHLLIFICQTIPHSPWSNRQISKFPAHNMECVKRRALLSVKANPNCKDQAEKAVEAAFERCYSDTFPFDRHPNLKF